MGPARRRAAVAAAAVALIGISCASCGIPLESTAKPLQADLPRRVVAPSTSTTIPAAAATKVDVYFVTTGRYVMPEIRYAKASDELPAAITSLLVGPSTSERAAGITTALGYTSSITLLSWKHVGNVVTLNFDSNFGYLSGTPERLGVAQVVYTATSIYPNDSVQFQLDTATLAVPLQNGELVSGPVHVSQYASLRSPVTTTTTVSATTSPATTTPAAGTTAPPATAGVTTSGSTPTTTSGSTPGSAPTASSAAGT